MNAQSLSKGCKLWGAVIEVTPHELVVSLPHGLRGHVAYAEASDWLHEQAKAAAAADIAAAAAGDAPAPASRKRKAATTALPPLTDLFSIGQLVGGTVVGLRTGREAPAAAAADRGAQGDGKVSGKGGGARRKRVDLSLRVSKLNSGLGEPPARPACFRSVLCFGGGWQCGCAARGAEDGKLVKVIQMLLGCFLRFTAPLNPHLASWSVQPHCATLPLLMPSMPVALPLQAPSR
jgi:hypothetical protein